MLFFKRRTYEFLSSGDKQALRDRKIAVNDSLKTSKLQAHIYWHKASLNECRETLISAHSENKKGGISPARSDCSI